MHDYFSYIANDGSIPEDAFRISPSQLSKFLDSTTQWYRENLLGETGFEGSTATELGTCVHAAAHMYFDTRSVDKAAINAYIDSISNPDIDKSLIRSQLKPMVECLINSFLSINTGTSAEPFVSTHVAHNVYAAGSIDMYDQNKATIYDYKTIGSLDSARVPSSFPRAYYFQQLAYAYIMRQNGHRVDYLKLVYVSRSNTGRISEKTGKPLKDYPSECNILTHTITDEDMQIIENTLKLIADSVHLWNTQPDLRYILAQDYRLKAPAKPILFKD